MRVPIPSDWNGQRWQCLQIQWPDSPQWRALLTGFMTTPNFGWYWNEKTGDLMQAIATGLEIYQRNLPYVKCSGETINEDTPQTETGAGEIDIWELIEMTGFVMDVKCESGYLWKQLYPCCTWVKVCPVPGGYDGSDPFADDETATYTACGKADALVDALWDVLDAGWDAQSQVNPFKWVGMVEAALPGYDLSDNAIWFLVQKSIDLDNDYSKADVLSDFKKQQLKCLAGGIFDNLPGGITQEQYDQWRGFSAVVWQGEQREWAQTGMEAIGAGNSAKITALGATNTAADCTCPDPTPEGPTDPTVNGWYMSRQYVVTTEDSGNYNTPACLRAVNEHDAFGVVIQAEWTASAPWNLKRMNSSSAGCSNYDFNAWGDTSDHMEASAQGHFFGDAAASVLDELLGAGGYTLQSSNYGTITDPNSPPVAYGQVCSHGFFGDDMEPGENFTIKLRFIYNTNSPSHG